MSRQGFSSEHDDVFALLLMIRKCALVSCLRTGDGRLVFPLTKQRREDTFCWLRQDEIGRRRERDLCRFRDRDFEFRTVKRRVLRNDSELLEIYEVVDTQSRSKN